MFAAADDQNEQIVIQKSLSRFSAWTNLFNCSDDHLIRHNICILSIGDLCQMIEMKHFFVNKLLLEFDPISYQCMEEWFNEHKRNDEANHLNVSSNLYLFYCENIRKYSKIANC